MIKSLSLSQDENDRLFLLSLHPFGQGHDGLAQCIKLAFDPVQKIQRHHHWKAHIAYKGEPCFHVFTSFQQDTPTGMTADWGLFHPSTVALWKHDIT